MLCQMSDLHTDSTLHKDKKHAIMLSLGLEAIEYAASLLGTHRVFRTADAIWSKIEL